MVEMIGVLLTVFHPNARVRANNRNAQGGGGVLDLTDSETDKFGVLYLIYCEEPFGISDNPLTLTEAEYETVQKLEVIGWRKFTAKLASNNSDFKIGITTKETRMLQYNDCEENERATMSDASDFWLVYMLLDETCTINVLRALEMKFNVRCFCCKQLRKRILNKKAGGDYSIVEKLKLRSGCSGILYSR